MAHPISELSGKFRGEEIWVLGNGPSLNDVDPDKLDPARVIGTNRILKFCDPRYLLFVDFEVWKQQHGQMSSSGAALITTPELWDTCSRLKMPIPDERLWMFTHSPNSYPDAPEGPLFRGFMSGYYAAELAARMVWGGGRVVLAGMDMRWPDEGDTHFFGDGREVGCHTRKFQEGLEAFAVLRHAARREVEFKVVGDSALRVCGFEGMDL